MYLIELTYKVELDQVMKHVEAHRNFLAHYYQTGQLLVSGPMNPKTGGVIVSLMDSLSDVEAFIEEDPFYTEGVADYKSTRFDGLRYHPEIQRVVDPVNDAPTELFKIMSESDWKGSEGQTHLKKGPIDHDFIHLATAIQVEKVAGKFFKDIPHRVLKLNPKSLEGRLLKERNPGGKELYYHLYEGQIPTSSVLEVKAGAMQ